MSTKTISTGLEKAKDSTAGAIEAKCPAIDILPDEIIEQILLVASPNVFASLIILNRKWRMVSQQAPLYAHHLSRCPSYSAAHHAVGGTVNEDSLPRLRRLFAEEIKRNIFDAYLRPRETIISLVSTSSSSSSAPGGEAFHFSLSPRGHYVLAYSSSRIHVIDVTGPEVIVKRELKILRRPASTTITDDGSLLAVLSTDLQVDLYDLTGGHPKHTHAVALDHTPRTIALSPTGAVLAAAYDSGVEVSALDADATSTGRRAVKCYAADSLSFSRDGTQLLGTTMQSRNSSTVILSAPYYNAEATLPEESVSALWTTSILFPNGSRDCSHAVLLPSASDGEASWAFTYDRVFETFRAVRIDDLRNGTTYFTGPIADSRSISMLLPSTLPTAHQSGNLVAAGFQGSIWLYGVPEDLDALPSVPASVNSNADSGVSTPSIQLGRRNSAPSLRSVHRGRESFSRIPQWQLLCDRFRNTFVEGQKIGSLDRVSAMSWVNDTPASFRGERLVAVAPGVGEGSSIGEYGGMSPVDGGRISILDFDYAISDGQKTSITIEVGMEEPQVLEEEHRDLDAEVAIVRRRTVAQRRGNRNHVSRSSATTSRGARPEPPPVPVIGDDLGDPYAAPNLAAKRLSNRISSTEQSETASIDEQEAFDAPYSHTSPRSGTTLRRAATAAAVNRRLHPPTVREHIVFRRADGREEHPHESDADNWVPPPPPYTKDEVPPLPEHIQRSIIAEATASTSKQANIPPQSTPESPTLNSGGLYRSRTVASSSTGRSRRESYPFQWSTSDSTTMDMNRGSLEVEPPRPASSPVSPEGFNDLYDVSPPSTPPPPAPQNSELNQIPRRPVGAPANTSPAARTPPRPGMVAALERPVSPMLEPAQPINVEVDPRLQSWNITPESEVIRSPNVAAVTPITAMPVDKDVPPRPTQDHHLTELPPSAPARNQREFLESQPTAQAQFSRNLHGNTEYAPAPLSTRAETTPIVRSEAIEDNPFIWRRSDTAPVPSSRPGNESSFGGLAMPSADQLARLNSRSGRPPGHVLTDPSRRLSGSSPNQQPPVRGNHRQTTFWESARHAPTHFPTDLPLRNSPPRAAAAAHNSYNQRNTIGASPSYYSYSTSSNRRSVGNPNLQLAPLSGNNLRPPMQRLETIHSATSTELSPYHTQRSINVGVGRQPSRAERSAAKNIQDAKKRGWRASMYKEKKEKKQKDKHGDTMSSAGWTDVSRESGNESVRVGD
ncbi:3-carboxy-cis,cis-mucoante lactonizing enzyme [Venustampulla echinocandica]|uniref:3-carboxy-cis,cis-mucoante lactonizing enzyme n=1 Tax=Venustampulla echinocandica TaxID=2656787 RepID=A0A370TMV7_9HELO|nr:3-carboxy-cis,cis-mucoante lactonizing enzyme [Venustampulla echinocandica]RDL36859.1 3-carboxy-cis,cis-mucoante lactonizing enzyme [Venustampulla echinocandica]